MENGHWLLWDLLLAVSDMEDEMLGWYQSCAVDMKSRRNKYVSFKPFLSVFIPISPESVLGVDGASSLSGDGGVGYYSMLPFMALLPNPTRGIISTDMI